MQVDLFGLKVQADPEPARRPCDIRCMCARGSRCECRCGGVNHRAGLLLGLPMRARREVKVADRQGVLFHD
jgi:hypothetical protein